MPSFADLPALERDRYRAIAARKALRTKVLWVQDRISLAVYHGRPQAEIKALLEELRELTSGATHN